MRARSLRTALVLWVAGAPQCNAASGLSGTWQGTYHSQPAKLLPDGGYPEGVNAFELRLRVRGETVTGQFQMLGVRPSPVRPILHGKLFGERACFDVITEDGDMRWCVLARGDRLAGTWSSGPEGGPMLDGAGVGARLFGIRGRRSAAPDDPGR